MLANIDCFQIGCNLVPRAFPFEIGPVPNFKGKSTGNEVEFHESHLSIPNTPDYQA